MEIESEYKVHNHFKDSTSSPNKKDPIALFKLDIIKNTTDDGFIYSTNPNSFESTFLFIFDKTLEELHKIPDVEPKILSDIPRT